MKPLLAILLLMLFVLVSCRGTGDKEEKAIPGKKVVIEGPEQKSKPPEEPALPEKIQYDRSDPDWEKKKSVDELLVALAADTWRERENAQKQLNKLVLNSDNIIDYLILRSLDQDDPEIGFRAKKAIEEYFSKKIYDPERKKGFIGLQLMEPGQMVINNENYNPIRVVMPQDGFPGKAAGIKQGDLILGVDGKVCKGKFTMNDFILYIAALKPGTEIKLLMFSLGNIEVKKIRLAARPDHVRPIGPKKSKKDLFKTWYKRKLSEIKEKGIGR